MIDDRIGRQIERIIASVEAGEPVDTVHETVLAGWNFVADGLERISDADERLTTD